MVHLGVDGGGGSGLVGTRDPMFAHVLRVLDLRLVERMGLVGVVFVGKGHHVVGVAFVIGQGRPTLVLQSVVAPSAILWRLWNC